jgi:hypothetical protein
MLLFYQVATRLSLTTCWQIVELQDDNKLLEQLVTWNNLEQVCWTRQLCSKLSTSRWQLINKLGTSSANTSCWQAVGSLRFYVCTTSLLMCVVQVKSIHKSFCLWPCQSCKSFCSVLFTMNWGVTHDNYINTHWVAALSPWRVKFTE